jgi:hypothetical protein
MMSGPVCESCGFENSASAPRCANCQGALNPFQQEKSHGPKLSTFFRVLIFTGLVTLLVLMCMSPDRDVAVNEDLDLQTFYRNLVRMEHSIRRGNQNSWAVLEGDVNRYLQQVVESASSSAGESSSRVVDMWVDIEESAVSLVLVNQWGPVHLAQRYRAVSSSDSVAPLSLSEVWVGKVRLPAFTNRFMMKSLTSAFEAFIRDRYILKNASEIRFGDEKAYLVNHQKSV